MAPATKDHETYSSAKGATLDMVKAHDDAIPVPKVIISMDPPEHQKMRKLVSNVFTPRAIASLEDMVREKVYERINALAPDSFDVVADFSALFPNEVITTIDLGHTGTPDAVATPWEETRRVLQTAEVFWLATADKLRH